MVSLITAGNSIQSGNNSILSGILNGLSENSDGTGTFAGANLQSIKSSLTSIDSKTSDTHSKIDAMRGSNSITDLATKLNAGLPSALDGDRLKVLLDANLSDTNSKIDAMRGSNSITDLATKLNAGLPSALDSDRLKVRLDADLSDTNSKIDAMRGSNSLTDLATKLNAGLPSALNSDQLKVSDSTTATKLGTIETDIEATNTKLDSVIGTLSSAHSTKGVILMGKVGDLTSDGQHDSTGIAQNDAQFIAVDGAGLVGVTGNFITENSLAFDSGNKSGTTQRVCIATDDIPIALVNTKLDTLEATLTAIETDASALETLQTSTNTKLDTLEATLTAIETDASANEVLLTSIKNNFMQKDSTATLRSNASVSAGDITSVIDLGASGSQQRNLTIYGSTTTSTAKFYIQFGATTTTADHILVDATESILKLKVGTSVYHYVISLRDVPERYASVICDVAGSNVNQFAVASS